MHGHYGKNQATVAWKWATPFSSPSQASPGGCHENFVSSLSQEGLTFLIWDQGRSAAFICRVTQADPSQSGESRVSRHLLVCATVIREPQQRLQWPRQLVWTSGHPFFRLLWSPLLAPPLFQMWWELFPLSVTPRAVMLPFHCRVRTERGRSPHTAFSPYCFPPHEPKEGLLKPEEMSLLS